MIPQEAQAGAGIVAYNEIGAGADIFVDTS
jgi:hypothetical protein